MQLTVVHSTVNCEDSTCPTIYIDQETGNYVLQGFILKPEDKAKMSIPSGEDAVVVPADFIQAFLANNQ